MYSVHKNVHDCTCTCVYMYVHAKCKVEVVVLMALHVEFLTPVPSNPHLWGELEFRTYIHSYNFTSGVEVYYVCTVQVQWLDI